MLPDGAACGNVIVGCACACDVLDANRTNLFLLGHPSHAYDTQGNLTTATRLANATYALDLDAIRAEHPPLLSYLSLRNQELIVAAALTLAIIIGGMLFIDAALSQQVASEVREKASHVASNVGEGAAGAIRVLDQTFNKGSNVDIAMRENEAVAEAKA